MKKLFLLISLFQFLLSYSQPPGGSGSGGRPSGGGNQQNQRPPQNNEKETKLFEETNINEAAGLITYNVEDVSKEIKPKTTEEKETIKALIIEFNTTIMEIQKSNKLLLESTELNARVKEKKAIESKDSKQMQEVKKSIHNNLKPVREEVIAVEKVMNTKMEQQLSEKTHKKWVKYFEKKKEKMQPKPLKDNKSNNDLDQNQRGPRDN